jgi:hypothetical protein
MIKQNVDAHTNGAPAVPSRLAMNRPGPQKGSTAPPPVKKTAEPNGQGDDIAQNRLTAKKLAEEKARARTVARAQAVAEKLSTATDQVSSAIAEAILQEVFPQAQSWNCEIIATDIDENMLRKVVAARYGYRSVNEVPDEYREKYLIEDGDEYVVRRRTASLVQAVHLNLHDLMAMRAMRGIDFIFCRNVLIYFDDLSRKAVVDHFYNALNPGGYVFLGHSESVGRVTTAFKLKRFESHLVYVKE